MWLLILIAVHAKNPGDIPGRVVMAFDSRLACEQALNSMSYWLKFDNFVIQGACHESQKVDTKTLQGLRPPR